MTNLIVCGHGAGDPGAVGNGTTEANETRRLGSAIVKASGGKIAMYDQSKDLYRAGGHSALKNYDVTEIHFNAFNGQAKGCEVLIKSGFNADAKDNALLAVLAKHFTNRGIKYRADLANMNTFANLGTPYRLIEVCFIDNSADMATYNKQFNALANDLAKALCGTSGQATPTPAPAPTPKPQPTVSITQVAKDVIAGKYGNGANRKTNLERAGYNYTTVQAEVNRLLGASSAPAPSRKSNTTIAKEVIRGDWGNGSERERRLRAAGYDYTAIQILVNQMM